MSEPVPVLTDEEVVAEILAAHAIIPSDDIQRTFCLCGETLFNSYAGGAPIEIDHWHRAHVASILAAYDNANQSDFPIVLLGQIRELLGATAEANDWRAEREGAADSLALDWLNYGEDTVEYRFGEALHDLTADRDRLRERVERAEADRSLISNAAASRDAWKDRALKAEARVTELERWSFQLVDIMGKPKQATIFLDGSPIFMGRDYSADIERTALPADTEGDA